MTQASFKLQRTRRKIKFSPQRVIIAGYTGRNQQEVRAHIDELAAHGIPAPAEIPTVFRTTLDRLTTAPDVEVLGGHTSGEAEVVLLVRGDEIWVAVGSDHTDRDLEKLNIAREFARNVAPARGETRGRRRDFHRHNSAYRWRLCTEGLFRSRTVRSKDEPRATMCLPRAPG
ncbi:MAG: DUF2848 family protein [Deltaproteobacteria bacterium]|nr:DUF2848 family protein [Deltaproteobacteria bacterium]